MPAPRRPRPSRRASSLAASALALGLAVALAGCSAPAAGPVDPGATPTAATIEDCGVAVTPRAAPAERIVAIKSTAAELVVALGLGDALVATAFLDGPAPAGVPSDAAAIEGMPSRESVLELEPDAVVAGWESAFAPEAVGDRAQLEALGITTWVSPAACWSTDVAPLTWEALLDEFGAAASALGVPEAGAALAAEQRQDLATIEPVASDASALWYSSGEDAPYVGAGSGAPQLVLETAGLTNVAAGVDETWTTLSWEAVAASDPDLIVLVDAPWHTAESKIERLRANPATAELAAVREERFVVVPFPMAEAGVGSVAAARLVADGAREMGLG
ncbi:ABC transporter substrate-binding protein [Agrococcus carbonis]|uniref:Iron complex transport system substrate-binding protein n=1 Tax=Agrococcus carbonis TaxID=684552 RepID=A0A1H1S1T3_9MICO|nr:ABC transporter substrate-binding protein [Agrococcus carbonis]SDS41189.1 iron complex transport system substrate-binding protein [Agrococcus carbonis]